MRKQSALRLKFLEHNMKKLFSFLTILLLIPSLAFGAASRDFDDTDDKIVIANENNFDFTQVTGAIWARSNSTEFADSAFISKGSDTATQIVWSVRNAFNAWKVYTS